MNTIELKVNGMMCSGCENRVKNALSLIDGIEEVQAKHENGIVTIKTSKEISIDEVKEAIQDLGYEVI